MKLPGMQKEIDGTVQHIPTHTPDAGSVARNYKGGTHMNALKAGQDNSVEESLEEMGYAVDGYWTVIQRDSKEYRVPRLAVHFRPIAVSGAAACPDRHFDGESGSAEIDYTILNEVCKSTDGSFYVVPRLRITLQLRGREIPILSACGR